MKPRTLRRGVLAASIASALAACSPARVLNATAPKGGVQITRDLPYGNLARQTLDIYRPAHTAAGAPVVIFFYGGSWRTGSKAIYPFLAATMARAGAVVVVPDYRLYPAVRYPEFLRDCAGAVAWVQHHPAQTATGALFLMGHSAGAYNAMMLGLDDEWLIAAGGEPEKLAGVIGLAGPYDFLPITDADIVPVFPDAGRESQPITYARAGSPPVLLLTGDDDRQVKPREARALAARMRAVGGHVELRTYKGIGHIGLVSAFAPALSWRAPVLNDVMAFIGAHHTPVPLLMRTSGVAKPRAHAGGAAPQPN